MVVVGRGREEKRREEKKKIFLTAATKFGRAAFSVTNLLAILLVLGNFLWHDVGVPPLPLLGTLSLKPNFYFSMKCA